MKARFIGMNKEWLNKHSIAEHNLCTLILTQLNDKYSKTSLSEINNFITDINKNFKENIEKYDIKINIKPLAKKDFFEVYLSVLDKDYQIKLPVICTSLWDLVSSISNYICSLIYDSPELRIASALEYKISAKKLKIKKAKSTSYTMSCEHSHIDVINIGSNTINFGINFAKVDSCNELFDIYDQARKHIQQLIDSCLIADLRMQQGNTQKVYFELAGHRFIINPHSFGYTFIPYKIKGDIVYTNYNTNSIDTPRFVTQEKVLNEEDSQEAIKIIDRLSDVVNGLFV